MGLYPNLTSVITEFYAVKKLLYRKLAEHGIFPESILMDVNSSGDDHSFSGCEGVEKGQDIFG